jgi:redox-sensitive bicupin YhaK (pirin superfamily)
MIIVRRAKERLHDRSANQEKWLTFDPRDRANTIACGFGALEILNEVRLAPGAGASRNEGHEVETLTYVHAGALACEDSAGPLRLLQAGEFQLVTCGLGLRHNKRNASRRNWAHFFQIRFYHAQAALEARHAERRFSVAERRGGLCVVASLDARRGSLRIGQDAMVYSALLDAGQHVVHELSEGRSAWLHVVQGQVALVDLLLSAGDSAGITAERAVSFTAGDESEVLLVNLGESTAGPLAESVASPTRRGPQPPCDPSL